MVKFRRIFFIASYILLILSTYTSYAQVVSSVKFGRNRVQYKKFKWKYYETKNFDTYFNQDGQELAKFVAQVAEEELPSIESFTEYNLQRKVNIIVYNQFSELQQSNIGIGQNWQALNGGGMGLTKLVNNKMIVYFNGDHQDLRRQIREGIAGILTQNILFGDDIGQFISNKALLDLPEWMTDGYVAFAAQNWSTNLDDQLKSQMLDGGYTKFNTFAYDHPLLAGHAFWYYIQEKYKKENVTYLFYLARIYKNLNKASQQVCKKKFQEVLADFMVYENDKYENDNNRRKPVPKGNDVGTFEVKRRKDYYRINVNPNKSDNSFAYVEYNKGIVRIKLNQDDGDRITTLLKYGIRSYQNETDPSYPIMAWDSKGTRLAVIYNQKGKLQLFIYDIVTRLKYPILDLTKDFSQVQDVKYMLDSKTLLLSAVKNGHTDIFTLNFETSKITQITNDVYDDLDATLVTFPNKTGIIFSSNRPSGNAKGGDTVLPSHNRYNIFLVTNFGGKPEFNQITQLSDLKYGNARFPTPYNSNHFTFISDENGIGNRYAGLFTTKAERPDTVVIIGDSLLRNPDSSEIYSVLKLYKKDKVDSVAIETITSDSAFSFPVSNYENTVLETRVAGDNHQVSELMRDGNDKELYKLKIDERALHDRNIKAPPTEYMKTIVMADNIAPKAAAAISNAVIDTAQANLYNLPADVPVKDTTTKKNDDIFQNEFANEGADTGLNLTATVVIPTDQNQSASSSKKAGGTLAKAKLFTYKPAKFEVDHGAAGLTNAPLFVIPQKYQYGQGPIQLAPTLGVLLSLGTIELLEDQTISGAISPGIAGGGSQELVTYQNVKRRFDWGLTYYRDVVPSTSDLTDGVNNYTFNVKTFTNLFQANVAYPFDNARRLGLTFGVRNDNTVYLTDANYGIIPLTIPNQSQSYAVTHLEYVYDNTLNPAQNIWEGGRYKIFADANKDITSGKNGTGKLDFDWGFDVRYYVPIYRNFIWAGRAAGNFSWGDEKTVYYLGGEDGELMLGSSTKSDGSPRYFNPYNQPAADQSYAFQSLAVNLRGYIQNVANGNNAVVLNSEFRLPVFTTLMNRPINNAFVRNFQLIQFIDLGDAWNGSYGGLSRPTSTYGQVPVQVTIKTGGIGPFAGGYGFGARSNLLGYFLKFDIGWPMGSFFGGQPVTYFGLGVDF
jgi:hypothetical protein